MIIVTNPRSLLAVMLIVFVVGVALASTHRATHSAQPNAHAKAKVVSPYACHGTAVSQLDG
jgi:hypothetical protein